MFKGLIISARPGHWVKNVIIFAALVFAREYANPAKIWMAILAFAAFSLAASAVYIANDIFDRENDRKHPLKQARPIASGKVPVLSAAIAAILLLAGSLTIALYINDATVLALIAYMILNLAYSIALKHVVIIDVMIVAVGFVIRAVAGALAIDVEISPWLLVCTTLLALFLSFGKRRHELVLLTDGAANHRKALANYSTPFLDQMISVTTSSTVVAYAFYTISPEISSHFGTRWLPVTIPYVLYGVFRYLYLIFKRDEGGNPTRLLITDLPLMICVALWLITVLLVIKFT